MRFLFILPVVVLLSACVGNVRQSELASFDLGAVAVAWKPAEVPLRGVDVAAPSWLATTAIQYRLLYADALRRQAYTESRWAAQPAELIERALNRQPAAGTGGCRLRLDLDELVQVFDAPGASRAQLDARASLLSPRGDVVLARKSFAVMHVAPSADARGGVAATSAAVQTLAGEIGHWLSLSARETPAIVERCKGG